MNTCPNYNDNTACSAGERRISRRFTVTVAAASPSLLLAPKCPPSPPHSPALIKQQHQSQQFEDREAGGSRFYSRKSNNVSIGSEQLEAIMLECEHLLDPVNDEKLVYHHQDFNSSSKSSNSSNSSSNSLSSLTLSTTSSSTSNGGGSSGKSVSTKKSKRKRASTFQIAVLSQAFRRLKCHFPNTITRTLLADRLGMDEKSVRFWFQNQRQNDKKYQQQRQMQMKVAKKSSSSLSQDNNNTSDGELKSKVVEQEQPKLIVNVEIPNNTSYYSLSTASCTSNEPLTEQLIDQIIQKHLLKLQHENQGLENSSSSNSPVSHHRKQITRGPNQFQRNVLNEVLSISQLYQLPSPTLRKKLATSLQLPISSINSWLQNQRLSYLTELASEAISKLKKSSNNNNDKSKSKGFESNNYDNDNGGEGIKVKEEKPQATEPAYNNGDDENCRLKYLADIISQIPNQPSNVIQDEQAKNPDLDIDTTNNSTHIEQMNRFHAFNQFHHQISNNHINMNENKHDNNNHNDNFTLSSISSIQQLIRYYQVMLSHLWMNLKASSSSPTSSGISGFENFERKAAEAASYNHDAIVNQHHIQHTMQLINLINQNIAFLQGLLVQASMSSSNGK